MKKLIIIIILSAAIGLSLTAYYPSLQYPFLQDDFHYLHFAQRALNEPGMILKPYEGFFRPVNTMVWTLMFLMFGIHAELYHLVILVLHGCNAFLAGYLCYQLSRNKTMFIVGTFLFCLNPVPFNTMYWISAFLTSGLVTGFILVSLTSYVRFLTNGSKVHYGISIAACACALGTHESSFILPALILPLHLLLKGKKSLSLLVPFILISTGMLLAVFTVSRFNKAQGIDLATMRFLSDKYHLADKGIRFRAYEFNVHSTAKFFRSLTMLFVNPFVNYYFPATSKGYALTTLFIVPFFLTAWLKETRHTVLIACLFIFVPLVMHSGSYFPIMFPRHAYLPSVGVAMLAACLIFAVTGKLMTRWKKCAAVLSFMVMSYYLIHGILYLRVDRSFPMHTDALRRNQQVTALTKIYNENNRPYMLCMDCPFAPIQFEAISSVFFNNKLINGTGSEPDAISQLNGARHIIVRFDKQIFKVVGEK